MPREARIAFWIALVEAVLSLVSGFSSPLFGVLLSAIYFAVAWGIGRDQRLAAVTGAWIQIVPVIVLGAERSIVGIVVLTAAGLAVFIAYFFLRAARKLSGGRGTPWLLVMAGWLLLWLCLRPFANSTGSMEDTLLIGDQVLVETVSPLLGPLPERGELIVFRYPVDRKQIFVKRVVGITGDRLRIQNKQLRLNGVSLQEPYARHKTEYIDSYRDNFPSDPNFPMYAPGTEMLKANVRNNEVVVPDGKYFVLGDNRDNSLDSRYWGFVQQSDIVGRPVVIYNSNPPGATPSILNERWSRLLKRP